MLISCDIAEHSREADFVVWRFGPGLAFLYPGFKPAFCAVKGDAIALVRGVGGEGIADLDVVGVFNLDGHLIEDVDVFFPDAAVAQVAVVLFVRDVELHKFFVFGDVPEERAFIFMRTAAAIGVAKLVIFAVEFEGTVCEDLNGVGVEPPVQQVKVMRGFVAEQRAASVSQSMPSAKVIGAVAGVEIPVEIGAGDDADFA